MYNEFSYIYDKLSFDINYEFYAENIKKLLKKYDIKKVRMLELACGTGRLTEHFFDDFENIDALDLSREMLEEFSRKFRLENVNLYNYDMTKFENKNSYDLIAILLDSINYVTDFESLKKLFKNSYENLKDGGLLVFDINSEYKLREIFGSNCYVYEYEDIFYTWDNFLEDDLVDMDLNFFVEEKDGRYRRIYEHQKERIYPLQTIKEELLKNNFKNIEIFDEDDFLKVKEDTMRILISAKK